MLFVLGADDPEMRRIEEILEEYDQVFTYATRNGERVTPDVAYRADLLLGTDLIWIECAPQEYKGKLLVIDHHRPGDPGYELPVELFWEASSLGQLSFLLERTRIPQEDIVLAALDHCPGAAFRGEVPGVCLREVLVRRVREISQAIGVSYLQVRRTIARYQKQVLDAPVLSMGKERVGDLRTAELGRGYSLEYLAAQTAAFLSGHAVLFQQETEQGTKWHLSGHASPHLIAIFQQSWAPAQGLKRIYGVPSRGYAGGYLPAERSA